MKREIKFRAWDGEQMVSPDYVDRNGLAWWKSNSIPTNSNNVMQYTGLKDKNGKEIYEGDILKINSSIQSVEYYKSCFVAMYIQKGENGFMEWRKNLSDHFKPEVIGNVHETRELLKS